MTDPKNDELDNQDSPFELEEDNPSSSEAPVPAELAEGDSSISDGGENTDGSGREDVSDAPLIVDLEEAKRTIETLLYVAHEPLRPRDISMVFRGVENINVKVVRKIISELMEEYADRTIQIVEVAEGYRMCTRLEFSPWVRRLLKHERRWRVSNAGLETLAIIAYKQPITKTEVEEIRRVDCSGVIHTLLERKLIRVLGRRDVIGRPIVYGTTPQFLEHFGFKNLTDMPKPEEFDVEMDLGVEIPDGDIIPLETKRDEEDGEAPLEGEERAIPAHANGSSNGHVIPAEEGEEELEAVATTEEEEQEE